MRLQIIQLLFVYILATHWTGCMVYLLDVAIASIPSDAFQGPGDEEPSFGSAYVAALVVGTNILVGDLVNVVNPAAQAFTCFALAMGCAMNAIIFGSVADMVANRNSLAASIRLKADQLAERVRILSLPPQITVRLREYFDFRWRRTLGMDDQRLFDDASENLRIEVALFLHKDLLQHSLLLKNMTHDMCEVLVSQLHREFFAPGEVVMSEGDTGVFMYFITHGLVQVSKKGMLQTWLLSEGASFGEMALMPFGLPIKNSYSKKAIFANEGRRNATIKTLDYCEMMKLHKADLAAVLRYPEVGSSLYIRSISGRLHSAIIRIAQSWPVTGACDAERCKAHLSSAADHGGPHGE